jgi:hypothetical protein
MVKKRLNNKKNNIISKVVLLEIKKPVINTIDTRIKYTILLNLLLTLKNINLLRMARNIIEIKVRNKLRFIPTATTKYMEK